MRGDLKGAATLITGIAGLRRNHLLEADVAELVDKQQRRRAISLPSSVLPKEQASILSVRQRIAPSYSLSTRSAMNHSIELPQLIFSI
jgi:hypothetical protein